MNLAGNPLPLNENMRAAYKAVGVPLWVTPQEAADSLRYEHWSAQISLELAEWFARVWSMAFATGYKGAEAIHTAPRSRPSPARKVGYAPPRAKELTGLLLDNIEGLHRKGCERRNLQVN